MNVAILSASRKVWLIRAFQQALGATGGGRVIALDIDPLAAALQAADAGVVGPRSDAPGYDAWLHEFCRAENVGLVVPTRDEELPILAALAGDLLRTGTKSAVGSPAGVALCQDKRRFVDFCRSHGFGVPAEVRNPRDPANFPAFVKPRRGKAGIGAQRVDSPADLQRRGYDPENDLLQELMTDPEYTVDVCVDWEGRVLSAVPRERVRVVDGESVVSRTVGDTALLQEAARLVGALDLAGHVTVQAFRDGRRTRFIEVNPRFGGGAALGFAAGCPTPEWLVRLVRGEAVAPCLGRYREGLWMFRHSADVFLPEEAVRGHARGAV